MSLIPDPPLGSGDVALRRVRVRDARVLERLLRENRAWLGPWEATFPSQTASVLPTLTELRGSIRALLGHARAGFGVPFVIERAGAVVGQVSISAIAHGSVSSAAIGYWVSQDVAGHGVTPRAVALATDYAFGFLRLHRIEIAIRPENAKSLRVVEKLGFRFEGVRRRFIHINGNWADHYTFALVAEEVPGGVLDRYLAGQVDPGLSVVPDWARDQVATPLATPGLPRRLWSPPRP